MKAVDDDEENQRGNTGHDRDLHNKSDDGIERKEMR